MGNTTNDICTLHPFERNRYFYGKLLTVRDFETEQSYFRGKDALINRIIHGGGIVCGLQIPKEISGTTVNISPGVAIDCCGREIVVSEGTSVDVGQFKGGQYYLYLKYDTCDKELVPCLANASTCEEKCEYNRIKEIFKVEVSTDKPDAGKVKVSGKVTESGGTTAIQSAILEAMQDGAVKSCAMTGTDGTYELLVASGTYTIQASASGFVKSEKSNISAPAENIDFTLEKATPLNPQKLKADLAQDYYEKYLQTCLQCGTQEDAKVLLAVINKTDTTITIDDTLTRKYRVIVPNNPMLYKLLSIHIADFNNPHQTTAEQVGALVSVDDVKNPGGNIDLIQDDAITITSDDAANTITIGETHSARTDNPHQTTAEQVGALVNINGVENPGEGVNLVSDGTITIEPVVVHEGTAQVGVGTPSTIILAPDASENDDAYNGMLIKITGGKGSGQIRTITDYVESTKVATVDSAWDTMPDKTSQYRVYENKITLTTSAQQVGALVSVEGMQNPGRNIDLDSPDGTINISTKIPSKEDEETEPKILLSLAENSITNIHVSTDANIAESKIAFDVTNGHDHDGKNSKKVSAHEHSGENITSGIVAEARIDSAIARDSEVAARFDPKEGHDHDGNDSKRVDTSNLNDDANVLLTAAQRTELTGGGVTTLHSHPGGQQMRWQRGSAWMEDQTMISVPNLLGSKNLVISLSFPDEKAVMYSSPPVVYKIETDLVYISATGYYMEALYNGPIEYVFLELTGAPVEELPALSETGNTYDDLQNGILTLTFNKKIVIGMVIPTNIVLANSATGGEIFSLSIEEITPQADGRVVTFTLVRSHRDIISKWQRLYVQLGAGAVMDSYGNVNEAMRARQEISIIQY